MDRAALDACLSLGFPCGGWVPAGRLDERGVIPERYPVESLVSGSYAERTLRNLAEADGTLIIHSGEVQGGTKLTLDECRRSRSPCLVIDVARDSPLQAADKAHDFVIENAIATLNVAGPRESEQPQAYPAARACVLALLKRIRNDRR